MFSNLDNLDNLVKLDIQQKKNILIERFKKNGLLLDCSLLHHSESSSECEGIPLPIQVTSQIPLWFLLTWESQWPPVAGWMQSRDSSSPASNLSDPTVHRYIFWLNKERSHRVTYHYDTKFHKTKLWLCVWNCLKINCQELTW